jgi:hypothetical protein
VFFHYVNVEFNIYYLSKNVNVEFGRCVAFFNSVYVQRVLGTDVTANLHFETDVLRIYVQRLIKHKCNATCITPLQIKCTTVHY